MPYRVLLIIKDQWWSDGLDLPTYLAALRHRKALAQRWNDCETAIRMPDGNIAGYRESHQFEQEIAALRKADRDEKKRLTPPPL